MDVVFGTHSVDTPPGAGTDKVWVRTDPRIDEELGNWGVTPTEAPEA